MIIYSLISSFPLFNFFSILCIITYFQRSKEEQDEYFSLSFLLTLLNVQCATYTSMSLCAFHTCADIIYSRCFLFYFAVFMYCWAVLINVHFIMTINLKEYTMQCLNCFAVYFQWTVNLFYIADSLYNEFPIFVWSFELVFNKSNSLLLVSFCSSEWPGLKPDSSDLQLHGHHCELGSSNGAKRPSLLHTHLTGGRHIPGHDQPRDSGCQQDHQAHDFRQCFPIYQTKEVFPICTDCNPSN